MFFILNSSDVQSPAPPKVSAPPTSIRAKIGAKVTMSCQATGRPAPNITWFKAGQEDEVMGSGESLQLIASEDSEGEFYCTASSVLFPSVSSPPARLSIARAPRLQAPTTQYTSFKDFQVYCSSDDPGHTSVKWTRGNSTVITGGRFSTSETKETERVTFVLHLANATFIDLGEYTCTVQNDVGSSSLDITLLEGEFLTGITSTTNYNPGVDSIVWALQLGLGVAGIFSCVLVLLAAIWFCRSLRRSAERAQEESCGKSSPGNDSLELRQRRSLSPEPPERHRPFEVSGPVLQTIRPDFAAFYGNPHLSSHLPQDEEDKGCNEEEPLVQYSAIYGNPALSLQPEKESPLPGSLPSPKTVYFSQTPAHQVHLVPNHHSTPKKAPPAAYVSRSEMGGDSSVYSEPLLGYEDISYSALELDCGAEDDISTLAD